MAKRLGQSISTVGKMYLKWSEKGQTTN